MPIVKFQEYAEWHFDACLELFDENCPAYFAENEKEDYKGFLKGAPHSYFIGVVNRKVVSAFGLGFDSNSDRGRLSWILVSPQCKGHGIGVMMMDFVKRMAIENGVSTIDIAASHLSARFFAKFGAEKLQEIADGWGLGMHRVDMELFL